MISNSIDKDFDQKLLYHIIETNGMIISHPKVIGFLKDNH